MNSMKKIEVDNGRFILYNGSFFVKTCNSHIVWTSARQDAHIFTCSLEADEALEQIERFLRAG
mgnify:CR=1 FL=1